MSVLIGIENCNTLEYHRDLKRLKFHERFLKVKSNSLFSTLRTLKTFNAATLFDMQENLKCQFQAFHK